MKWIFCDVQVVVVHVRKIVGSWKIKKWSVRWRDILECNPYAAHEAIWYGAKMNMVGVGWLLSGC